MNRTPKQQTSVSLRVEQTTQWIKDTWMTARPDTDWIIISTANVCMDESVLAKFTEKPILEGGYLYSESYAIQPDNYPIVYNWYGKGTITQRSGAFVYHFEPADAFPEKELKEGEEAPDPATLPTEPIQALMVSYYISDSQHLSHLVCLPREFVETWASFISTCQALRRPHNKVTIVGGNQRNYEPRVKLEDIILPEELKQDILDDVDKFFSRGVGIYRKMNLNPFRKILLAGVPGTGKTMLCNAIANWALEQDYDVLYVSGADARGANFFKIQQALAISSNSKIPTLIILEEIDSFLNNKQKSMILNVLDGVEAFENEAGTMLIATTNYPEAIDDRVLKRPGRLDRIYIVPPAQNTEIAERMLRQYMGEMFREEHLSIASKLIDYPGAFIREVCVFAMTQAIDPDASEDDEVTVTVDLLEDSFERLKKQIKAREALIDQKDPQEREFGFAARSNGNGNGSKN
ncbi:MAG: ATP-binding protein [Chloroflexota bacterium]